VKEQDELAGVGASFGSIAGGFDELGAEGHVMREVGDDHIARGVQLHHHGAGCGAGVRGPPDTQKEKEFYSAVPTQQLTP